MAHNLQALAEAKKLFSECTYYSIATGSLDDIIVVHREKFMVELSKDPTSLELQLSFRVLHDSNQSSLKPHLSSTSQDLISGVHNDLFILYVSFHTKSII
jgi:hypothetical protein